jgi:CheY-like chemotaxis protein
MHSADAALRIPRVGNEVMGETQGVRVLVVDDDAAIREFVALALGMEGCAVRTAEHGREALSVAREWSPDLIVLDLNMPIMDGWTFREEQRRQPAIAEVPVIVASAGQNLAVRPEVLEPCRYLEKPFDLDDLNRAVGKCAG